MASWTALAGSACAAWLAASHDMRYASWKKAYLVPICLHDYGALRGSLAFGGAPTMSDLPSCACEMRGGNGGRAAQWSRSSSAGACAIGWWWGTGQSFGTPSWEVAPGT